MRRREGLQWADAHPGYTRINLNEKKKGTITDRRNGNKIILGSVRRMEKFLKKLRRLK